ncbi:MAG: hypothetical protein QXX12_08135, partial [Nanopusillaceae archaeon]
MILQLVQAEYIWLAITSLLLCEPAVKCGLEMREYRRRVEGMWLDMVACGWMWQHVATDKFKSRR